jgi:hypothetical protein
MIFGIVHSKFSLFKLLNSLNQFNNNTCLTEPHKKHRLIGLHIDSMFVLLCVLCAYCGSK